MSGPSCRSARIVDVRAWEALDSRGRPTVAARVYIEGGRSAAASVPAGASAGSHEAIDLRDGGLRYAGRGVRAAVSNVNTTIREAVTGLDAAEPGTVDAQLRKTDPSPGFARLGANAMLAVSIAALSAAAANSGCSLARWIAGDGPLQLPMPMVNIISGGAHAAGAIDVQDLLVIPRAAASFAEAIEWCAGIRDATADIALRSGKASAVLAADEGGIGVKMAGNRQALELLQAGIEAAGLKPGHQVGIAIDVAATQLLRDGRYRLARENRTCSAAELIGEVARWCDEFPILSVEDILAEDDWQGWEQATSRLGSRVQVIGDDLFATNPARLSRGIEDRAANAVLAKVNQNGLVSGTKDVIDLARQAGFGVVVSARSGETEDCWLADLAVGWQAEQIKVGSTHRSERGAKWNRLLELEALEDTKFARPWEPHPPLHQGDRHDRL